MSHSAALSLDAHRNVESCRTLTSKLAVSSAVCWCRIKLQCLLSAVTVCLTFHCFRLLASQDQDLQLLPSIFCKCCATTQRLHDKCMLNCFPPLFKNILGRCFALELSTSALIKLGQCSKKELSSCSILQPLCTCVDSFGCAQYPTRSASTLQQSLLPLSIHALSAPLLCVQELSTCAHAVYKSATIQNISAVEMVIESWDFGAGRTLQPLISRMEPTTTSFTPASAVMGTRPKTTPPAPLANSAQR